MASARILVADDDELIVDALSYQLGREGYEVLTAFDGESALAIGIHQKPDIILLDVMMPKKQGWEVCRELRHTSTVPILMLTARGEEIDRVLGLELGADDYIVKPFSFRELLARVHAQLRRASYASNESTGHTSNEVGAIHNIHHFGTITVDLERHVVSCHNQIVHLSFREFEILRTLIEGKGAVIKRGDLLDKVWGEDWVGDPRTLDVHIRWLREKLEEDDSKPRLILTVRNVGYRMVSPQELKVS